MPTEENATERSPLSDGESVGMRRRKKQFRWKLVHDLALAKEVQLVQPLNQPGRKITEAWTEIGKKINDLFEEANVDQLAVSRRFNLITESHRKKETQNRYKSGTEEEVTQLDELLNSLISQIDDAKLHKEAVSEAKQKKIDDQKTRAEEIRKAAAGTVKRKPEDAENCEAPQKRISDASLVGLWSEKQVADKAREDRKEKMETQRLELEKQEREKDRGLKELEIQLAQDRMKLEREQFEHQRHKDEEDLKIRNRALDLQEQERKSQIDTQNSLIQLLLKKL